MAARGPVAALYSLLRYMPRFPRLHWLAARLTNDKFLLGVMGMIENEDRELLLFSHTYRQVRWGFPGGWIKRGETPQAALEREVLEESGLTIQAGRLLLVGWTPDRPKLEFVVAGQPVSGTFRPSNEVNAMRWSARDQLPPLVPIHRHILDQLRMLPPGEVGIYVTPWKRESRST